MVRLRPSPCHHRAADGRRRGDRRRALPEKLTHDHIAAVLQALWRLEAVCHYLWTALATVARRVNGSVSESYDRRTAVAIARDFSDRWDGCPDEALGQSLMR